MERKEVKWILVSVILIAICLIVASFFVGRATKPVQVKYIYVDRDSTVAKLRTLDSLRYVELQKHVQDLIKTYSKPPDSIAAEINEWYKNQPSQ